jgi:hypothetical protein
MRAEPASNAVARSVVPNNATELKDPPEIVY